MTAIRFQSSKATLELLNPLKGFHLDSQEVQLRRDPLLGHVSVYNPNLKDKAKLFFGDTDRELIRRLAESSAGSCFFCPDRIASTARYPDSLIHGGRIEIGETVLFPNLFALAQYHAVAAVSRAHFLELTQFTPTLVADALNAMQRYTRRVFEYDDGADYVSVNGNYLFPAGASLMHPHFQILITPEPYTHQATLADACRGYREKCGSAYHFDLIATERSLGARSRYIARTGGWHWLAAFAPMGSNEILAVHERLGDFSGLTESDLNEMAQGMAAVLRLFDDLGHLSFNFSLYARRERGQADGFNCLLRMITRQNPAANYRTDDFFLQKGLQTELILNPPEDLAARARRFF